MGLLASDVQRGGGMKLSESIKPADYCPIKLSEYNQAVAHWGQLRRDGKTDEAAKAEEAAKEIGRRLVGGLQ